jgi:SNF2 family DNA or RNA helicase
LDPRADRRAQPAFRGVQLRRRKADVLDDLPEKLVSEIVLPLSPRQRESYERAERDGIVELRGLGQQVTIEHVFNLVLRLRQICNVCPRSGESSKLTDLRERIAVLAAEGHKALVFTQFTNAAYGARAIAARLGPDALVYTGDMGQTERERVLTRFREDPEAPVLILSLGAGGQGLNLQAASYVFHFDRWWNPAVERQAEARSHRIGQQRAVNVYTYTSERTIEERITQILRGKQRLFDELVEDVSIDPAESPDLTSADLLALFGLSAS